MVAIVLDIVAVSLQRIGVALIPELRHGSGIQENKTSSLQAIVIDFFPVKVSAEATPAR